MYFTKVNGVCYGPEGQGGEPQIEVTQEMIDAGVAALRSLVFVPSLTGSPVYGHVPRM